MVHRPLSCLLLRPHALLIFAYLGTGSLRPVLSLSVCILELDNDHSDDPGRDMSA